MSTRVKDRKNNNKFEILTKITNLCGRTRDIVNHEKFNANVTLSTDLINSAEAIYFFARRANRYRTDRTKEELLKRRELQNKAIDRCDWFFGEVQETKVVIHISPNKVKAERRKLRRMVSLVRKGKMRKKCVDEHFGSWMVHACFGNSKSFRKKMICYYNSLWEENNDRTVDHKVQEVYC